MYNWSFVRLPRCISFLTFCVVCETVPHLAIPPPCILSLSTQSHWSFLHKGGRTFLFKLRWIGSPLEAEWGFSGSVVVLGIVLAREKDLFSVSSLFLISDDVFVFQISNFHDTSLAVDSERPCQRNQDCGEEKKIKSAAYLHLVNQFSQ